MNPAVHAAAMHFVERSAQLGSHGRTITDDEVEELRARIGPALPQWYMDLLKAVPICGLELSWEINQPEVGYHAWLPFEWNTPEAAIGETCEAYPGIALLPRGYFCAASDSGGGGNPLFLRGLNVDDPPPLMVYHDYGIDPDVLLTKGTVILAPSLSEFFDRAEAVPPLELAEEWLKSGQEE